MSQLNSQERPRRRKAALACESCRERKIRCDGGKPICAACRRRGLSLEQCVYTIDNARTANRDSYIQSLHDRIRSLEKTLQQNGTTVPPVGDESCTTIGARSFSVTPDVNLENGSSDNGGSSEGATGTIPHRPVIGTISTENTDTAEAGNGVTAMGTLDLEDDISTSFSEPGPFYGSSSAASFMREAVETANSPAYSGQRRNNAIDSPSTAGSPKKPQRPQTNLAHIYSENYNLPPRSLADHLLERFWEKVYYLYPVFDRPAFERAYRELWQPQTKKDNPQSLSNIGLGGAPGHGGHPMLFHCALNTIFAIGVSFSDIPAAAKDTTSLAFFLKAKQFIGLDLLELNNIGVVQVLLLVTIFLQSTQYPTRCWNSIGIACRVALGLGLHIGAPHRGHSPLEIEVSKRTWHGCVMLDMTVSMTFGRPAMTLNLPERLELDRSGTATYAGTDAASQGQEPVRFIFFTKYYQLCRLLEDILKQVYQSGNFGSSSEPATTIEHTDDFTALFHLENKLLQYEESLLPLLSWKQPMDLGEISQSSQSTIKTQRLVLHGRFLYLKIMLHRPAFTQYCSSSENDHMLTDMYKSFMLQRAKNCVQSSLDLISLVYSSHRNIASEWWWDSLFACTCGLVLIFSQLRPELRYCFDSSVIQDHLEYSEAVLDYLSTNNSSIPKTQKLLRRVRDQVIKGKSLIYYYLDARINPD
ncbi:fungal-specific transcription factor domain-containing protein [Xylaria arbuscula]|nr:fungal-specific transcription factor domain-containing protein [Xylaria arbuscula]